MPHREGQGTLRSSLNTQLGLIAITTNIDGVLQTIQLPPGASPRPQLEPLDPTPAIHRPIHRQLRAYLSGQRQHLSLPFDARGTRFQETVWAQLRAIPWGETRAYVEVARALGKPGAARAVGTACGRNPLPLLIPCHRVLAAGGGLGGWTGDPQVKRDLLQLEGSLATANAKGWVS